MWIRKGRSHTRAVACLNDILPHQLQRADIPFAVHITPYDHPRCEHHDLPCSSACISPLRQPLLAPTISGNMYLGTVPGDPGIYILPNRCREHAIPLHGVESLVLGPPPPKHHQQHILGDRRSQGTDGGSEAQKHALAHITVHVTAHLPKKLNTERHIVQVGQGQHIITAAPYTLAAHKHHWDPTTMPGIPHHCRALKTPSPSSKSINSSAAPPPRISTPPEWK